MSTRMATIIYPGLICMLLLFACSCTEIIELDLKSSDSQVVIEGKVANNGELPIIKITKSVNFDESNVFPSVENAVVTLKDNLENIEVLEESSPGVYTTITLLGEVGRTYSLTVEIEGQVLSSQSTIPEQVDFESLEVKEVTDGGFGGGSGSNYEVKVKYSDPESEQNYYRFVEFVNGAPTGDIFIFDDRLSDGLTVENILLSFDRKLSSGDILTVEMQCVDSEVYNYFKSFGNLVGGPQNSSTPANPNTNILGSKLGYFSAHTVQRKSVIIQ